MNFFKGKSVYVTGHTGFKGAWLCEMLKKFGAIVTGYALEPNPGSLFEMIQGQQGIQSVIGDIRDYNKLSDAFAKAKPEIVFHLAAQPLVIDSYTQPVYTFETNTIGTVNILECVRKSSTVRSVIIVTTDKVYKNMEHPRGYQETDKLGGRDPYSASKACAELAAESYNASFLKPNGIPMSTARAGNVIGGGDISENRIIPDCVRAATAGKNIVVRNPAAVRPYQHVLEPLVAYLLIAMRQWEDHSFSGNYNIGPEESDCITTGRLADIFCNSWGDGVIWEKVAMADSHHEAGLLYLDCGKIQERLNWRPIWDAQKAVNKTVTWEKARINNENLLNITQKQIGEYFLESGISNG